MHVLITRKDAHAKGLKTFFTGQPCKHGHVSERYVSNGGCSQCQNQFARTNVNPWTKELIAYQLPQGFYVPATMSAEQYAALREYLHQCVEHWVGANGLATPSVQNAYQQAAMHRARKATT